MTIPNAMKIAHNGTQIELEGYLLAAQPYIYDDCSYGFLVENDSRVFVTDPNFDEPMKLSQWVSDMATFADREYTPADMTDLTIDIHRRLTTEQGDFTTLMIVSGGLRYVSKASEVNRSSSTNG